MMQCKVHPNYKGAKKPSYRWSDHPDKVGNGSCVHCWTIYLVKTKGNI